MITDIDIIFYFCLSYIFVFGIFKCKYTSQIKTIKLIKCWFNFNFNSKDPSLSSIIVLTFLLPYYFALTIKYTFYVVLKSIRIYFEKCSKGRKQRKKEFHKYWKKINKEG